MPNVDRVSRGGGAPPGIDIILDAPDSLAASGEAPAQNRVAHFETGVFDLQGGNSHSGPTSPAIPVPNFVALATAHLRSAHSKRAYRQAVLEFMAWCVCTGTTNLTKTAVVEYIGELNRLRMAPATINLALCAIRRLVSELADNELLSSESAAKIMRIKGPRRKGVRLGNWLNAGNATRFARAPDTRTKKGKRDRAVMAVLLGAGVRRGEAAQLSLSQIQQREDRWVIVDLLGKHDRIRSVPIPVWTKQAIDEWTAAADLRSGAIFRRIDKAGKVHDGAISANAIYQIVRQHSAAVGVALAPHDVRRTFAKLALDGKAGLDQIQLALGHASILTTERYLGILQNLRDAPCDHLGLAL